MAFQQLMCGLTAIILLSKGCESQTAGSVCGVASRNTRIVGGQDSSPGSWPWQATLTINNKPFCGGSLINNEWVLTAAHCIEGDKDAITIYLGRHSQSGSNANEVSQGIAQVVCHPSYDFLTNENDICLLKLSSPVNFTDYISPVCLASVGSTFHTGTISWVTGWGNTVNNGSYNPADILQELKVPIVGLNECRCSIRLTVTENMICAGFKAGGKDACQGDSGGPLVIKNSSRWIQSGIVSFGEGCAKPNRPGIYTHVSKYQRWISITTGIKDIFMTYTSPGPDSDKNFTCPTSPPPTTPTTTTSPTTPITTTPITKVTKCKGGGSLFDAGESVMRVSLFTHFVSLSVLLLSLYVLVGDA